MVQEGPLSAGDVCMPVSSALITTMSHLQYTQPRPARLPQGFAPQMRRPWVREVAKPMKFASRPCNQIQDLSSECELIHVQGSWAVKHLLYPLHWWPCAWALLLTNLPQQAHIMSAKEACCMLIFNL